MTSKKWSTPADFLTYDNPGNPTGYKDVAKGSEAAKTSPGQYAGHRGVAGEVAALDVAPKRAGQNAVVDASEELSWRRDRQQPDRYEAAPASRVIKAAQTPPAVAQAAGSRQQGVHARQNGGENEHCAGSNTAQHDTQEQAGASRADGHSDGSGYGRSGRGKAGLKTTQSTPRKEEEDTIVEDNVDETRAMPSAQKGAPKHDGDLRHGGIRGCVDVEEQSAGDEEAVNRRKSTRDGAGGGLGCKVIVSPPAKGPQRRSTGSTTGTADDVDKDACESQAECTGNSNSRGGLILKSKTDVTEVNFAQHVAETAKHDKQVTRRSPNDDIVEMEQGGGSHEIVPTREDAEEVNKDEKAEDVDTGG